MRHDYFEERDGEAVNPSTEPTIREVISRRMMLKGMAAGGAFGLFGAGSGCAAIGGTQRAGDGSAPLTFPEIPRFKDEQHHVAPGYNVQVLLRQGDPIRPGAPEYNPATQTGADQERQFGTDCDFIGYMPLPAGSNSSTRGLLGVNHENHRAAICFPGNPKQLSREQVEVQMAAQGFSVVEIAKEANQWRIVKDSRYNRRISTNAPMRISGPAAGSLRMQTSADPRGTRSLGTVNNCAGGTTPWGTFLTAEENIQNYFVGDAGKGPEAAPRKRYAITGKGRYDDWGRYFDRFNLDKEPNEPNRFGWIVEIDPYDPDHTSVKRTALGRAAHECATTAVNHDGRVAVYSGDDARMEFVYKFVTEGRFDPSNRAANRDLLDRGTLYAARFEASGKMRWLPLVFGQGPLTPANGFNSQADVVIEARRAGTLLGATPMDRPEDVEPHPLTGNIYVVMTYNERRTAAQVDAANPRAENKYGHIIEIVPPRVNGKPDHAATECDWGFFILAGNPADPSHGARYANPVTVNGWLVAPDNVAFDPKGRIWISTDGQDDWAGFNDSLYGAATSGPTRGATRAFFTGPAGCEICGPCFAPDGKTLFLAIQHPGDGSTFDKPSTRWPDFRNDLPPRGAVIAVTKADGGEIGS
ncbi:MAG TPA: PhoX family phosphatase [Burkholderiales bacterium]|nr:PhoX family phosphatase [Burkholderiales bacterium]